MRKTLPFLLIITSTLLGTNEPRITLSASAEVRKSPDLFELSLGVVTEAKEAASAMAQNNQRMQQVLKGVRELGFAANELGSAQFTLTPQYSTPPKERPANWSPKIASYRVENTLSVRSDKMSLLGTLIDTANKLGTNRIDALRFALKDERPAKQEAITLATKNLLSDAKTLAEAANSRIDRILSLTLDNAAAPPLYPKARMQLASYNASTPLEPSAVAVSASVAGEFSLDESPH